MGEHDYPVIEATQVNVNTVTEQKEHICAKPRTPSRRIHNWSKPLHLTCHVLQWAAPSGVLMLVIPFQ